MKDFLGGMSPEALEAVARRLIVQGPEGAKVDFKRALSVQSKAEKAEFAKDVSAIANTDDEHLSDFGFIVIGAERGNLCGGASELAPDRVDHFQSHLTNVLTELLVPVPAFSLVPFMDAEKGAWGVVLIQPSGRQPHIFIRDVDGVGKHDWLVRVNDTTARAGALDYARLVEKAVVRAVRPFEREVQRLAMRVDEIQRAGASVEGLASLIRSGVTGAASEPPPEDVASAGVVGRVRNHLVQGVSAIEDSLVAEAMRLAEVMRESSDQNPWTFSSISQPVVLPVLEYLEEQTRPFAVALANIARYDSEGGLSYAVVRALRILAEEPSPNGVHYTYAAQFRLYPAVLSLYAVTLVGVQERRSNLLGDVFRVPVRSEYDDRANPLSVAVRLLLSSEEVFKAAIQQNYFAPVSERLKTVVVPWCAGLLPGLTGSTAFYQAEFVIALAFQEVSAEYQRGRPFPLPGCYLFYREARRAIRQLLTGRPEWLRQLYGRPVEELLVEFDTTASTWVRVGSGDGFIGGAAEAFGISQSPKARS